MTTKTRSPKYRVIGARNGQTGIVLASCRTMASALRAMGTELACMGSGSWAAVDYIDSNGVSHPEIAFCSLR